MCTDFFMGFGWKFNIWKVSWHHHVKMCAFIHTQPCIVFWTLLVETVYLLVGCLKKNMSGCGSVLVKQKLWKCRGKALVNWGVTLTDRRLRLQCFPRHGCVVPIETWTEMFQIWELFRFYNICINFTSRAPLIWKFKIWNTSNSSKSFEFRTF